MNVSMDLNNILNQVQNNINIDKTSLATGNDTFLAMLNSMMAENNLNQLSGSTYNGNTETDNGFMKLLAGNGTDYLNLAGMNNTDINEIMGNVDIFASVDTEKSDHEYSIESSYMMQNYLNLIAPQIAGITGNTDSAADVSMLSDLNKLQGINHNMYQNNPYNNVNAGNSDIKSSDMDEGQVRNEKAVLSPQAEKLISEIEARRNKLKSDINSNAEMLNFNSNKNIVPEGNKVIQLSDESTQIRSQVVEQVRDNIVMLTEIDTADGSTAKQVTMELYPRELGKVDIKMTMVDNKMTVEIKALNEETQKILASGADDLLKSLSKTAESISIVFKSNNPVQEQIVNYYDKEIQANEFNHDDQNLDQDNKRRNEYYYDEDNKNSDDDTFSELMNSTGTITNQ
ncbi:flagellar hook-length control protein FliK [Sedimentibacter sp.]|uniref:flagellar hook-length control protein FliK n=1 Tax=Sedimentibacter sp. TaxID=1960295 RepID=UPI002899C6D6|nr:flagellar hook-length control protein FliK [Sedimentibacter sp.]